MGQLKDKIVNLEDGKAIYDKILEKTITKENGYIVGDVYETLSTSETISTLATRFGGTWTTLPDRLEWDRKNYDSGNFHATLNADGIVTYTDNAYSPAGVTSTYYVMRTLGEDYQPASETVGVMQGTRGIAKRFTINVNGNVQGININYAEQPGTAVSGEEYWYLSIAYRTSKEADRTFKRFKRVS